jgi:hypothetical protein
LIKGIVGSGVSIAACPASAIGHAAQRRRIEERRSYRAISQSYFAASVEELNPEANPLENLKT